MDSRINIKKKNKVTVNGRWQKNLADYYSCWCTPMDLYGKELYDAINIKYENTLIFKVRYCNKIKDMRTTEKSKFIVTFEGVNYEIYQVDFKANSKEYVYIKAKMVI